MSLWVIILCRLFDRGELTEEQLSNMLYEHEMGLWNRIRVIDV